MTVTTDEEIGFPTGTADEQELFLRWLAFLRGAVIRKIEGLGDEEARWTPDGALISLLGIVNHLTHAEWRWIDGGMLGEEVTKDEDEYTPGAELTVGAAIDAYRARARATDATVRAMPSLTEPCRWGEGTDLRWVLLHLINETARHAGHADATASFSTAPPESEAARLRADAGVVVLDRGVGLGGGVLQCGLGIDALQEHAVLRVTDDVVDEPAPVRSPRRLRRGCSRRPGAGRRPP